MSVCAVYSDFFVNNCSGRDRYNRLARSQKPTKNYYPPWCDVIGWIEWLGWEVFALARIIKEIVRIIIVSSVIYIHQSNDITITKSILHHYCHSATCQSTMPDHSEPFQYWVAQWLTQQHDWQILLMAMQMQCSISWIVCIDSWSMQWKTDISPFTLHS